MPDAPADARDILEAITEKTAFPKRLAGLYSIDDAYVVQFELLELRRTKGERAAGWKVGLTSLAMQRQQNLHEPCLGHLLESGHERSPAILLHSGLVAAGFENELCLRIGRPLPPHATLREAAAAVEAVAPALELVERRGVHGSDLAPDFPLTIAGNAQHRAFVTGAFTPYAPDIELAAVEAELFVNGMSRERASGAEVLGDPLNALVWLANKLARFGHALKPGDLVMSGSFTRQYAAKPGDRARAVFTGLGEVEIHFSCADQAGQDRGV